MSLVSRITAGAALAAVLGLGVFVGSASTATSSRRSEALLAQQIDPQVAQERALAREHNAAGTTGYFAAKLREDFEKYSLREISVEELGRPNRFVLEISEATPLGVGDPLVVEHLRMKVTRPKIAAQNHGMSVSRTHSIVTVENVSDTPIAYYLAISAKQDATCRGSRKHNAMALLPGESAEVLACPGEDSFVVEQLRILEVTPIGYLYVSMLPPTAVGHHAELARAHSSANIVELCTQVPAVKLAAGIAAGEFAWEDVVDYFARHSCQRHGFPSGYRLATTPITEFPVSAANPASAAPSEAIAPASRASSARDGDVPGDTAG